MIHAKTRSKGIVDKLYDLGISISYSRVVELSTSLGNEILHQYEQEGVVCPPTLKKSVFTTSALDNIDHNPSSTTSEGSFHGTGISLFQHITKDNPGLEQDRRPKLTKSSKLAGLPEVYANVKAVTSFKNEPAIQDYSNVEEGSRENDEIKKEER